MSDTKSTNEKGDSCGTCALKSTRRDFFREAAVAVATIAGALGIPVRAQALAFVRAAWAVAGNVAYPLPSADGVTIDKDHEIILVRHQGSVYAFALSCPHQRTALKWKEEDGRFQCPKHKSKYQPDGTFISGRATRGMDRYAVQKKGKEIVVDVTKVFRQDKERGKWDAAVVAVGGPNVR